MQSMLYEARWMDRYARTEAEQEDGSCVAEYRKAGRYLISVRPKGVASVLSEQGDVRTPLFRAWVNDTHAFQPGDRLGESEQEYVVISTLDNYTGQSMEVQML